MRNAGGASMPVKVTAKLMRTFQGERAHEVELQHPTVIYRLGGKRIADDQGKSIVDVNEAGLYWFSEKFFWKMVDIVSEHQMDQYAFTSNLRNILRESLAVCYDWNSFACYYKLQVPLGVKLHAVCGFVAAQPLFKDETHARRLNPGDMAEEDQFLGRDIGKANFIGGGLQYAIDVRDVAHHIKGPIPIDVVGPIPDEGGLVGNA
jgi:hypothetical protein